MRASAWQILPRIKGAPHLISPTVNFSVITNHSIIFWFDAPAFLRGGDRGAGQSETTSEISNLKFQLAEMRCWTHPISTAEATPANPQFLIDAPPQ